MPRPDPGGDSLSASGITCERGRATPAPAPAPSPSPARDCSGPAPRRTAGPAKLRPRGPAPLPIPGQRGESRALPELSGLQGMGSAAPRRLHHPDRLRSGCAGTGLPGRAAVGGHGAARAAGPPQPGAALHRRDEQSPGWGQVGMGILPPSQPRRGAPAVTWFRPGRAGARCVLPGPGWSSARVARLRPAPGRAGPGRAATGGAGAAEKGPFRCR